MYDKLFDSLTKEINTHGFSVQRYKNKPEKYLGRISYHQKKIGVNEIDDRLAFVVLCHEYGHLLIHRHNKTPGEEHADFLGWMVYKKYIKNATYKEWENINSIKVW